MPRERINPDIRKGKHVNEASHSLGRIAAGTEELRVTAVGLTDDQIREPSLLPGWTRGHVLTHLARNADGLRNLLTWARTGIETPMYPSAQAREADIEAGAGRTAAELAADVVQSAAAFAAEAASMPDEAWATMVRALYGAPFPGSVILGRRLSEVVIHHSDLGAGYTPGDWPEDFVVGALPRVAAAFAGREGTPSCLLRSEGTPEQQFLIGPALPGAQAPGQPEIIVAGQPRELLGWLTGRSGGAGLTVAAGGALPQLPPW
jgi:maleylpyruvate isomerase